MLQSIGTNLQFEAKCVVENYTKICSDNYSVINAKVYDRAGFKQITGHGLCGCFGCVSIQKTNKMS